MFAQAAIIEYHTSGGLNNRNVLLAVLEAEVQDPGAGRFGFFEASLLDCRWQPSRCLHMIGKKPCFQLCTILDVSLCVQMSSFKDTSYTGLGPHRWPHIKLIAS